MFGVSQSFSFFIFLKSIGMGFLLGVFQYFFRLLRLIGVSRPLAVFLQDILFCCISAILIFLFVFEINAGVFRFYIFAGVFMGCAVFYSVPGTAADYFINMITGKKKNHTLLKSAEKNKMEINKKQQKNNMQK